MRSSAGWRCSTSSARSGIFRTLWHPRGFGGVARTIFTVLWRMTRPLSRGNRSSGLSGPLALVSTVAAWTTLVVVGWALIYLPHLPGGFNYSSSLDPARSSGTRDGDLHLVRVRRDAGPRGHRPRGVMAAGGTGGQLPHRDKWRAPRSHRGRSSRERTRGASRGGGVAAVVDDLSTAVATRYPHLDDHAADDPAAVMGAFARDHQHDQVRLGRGG